MSINERFNILCRKIGAKLQINPSEQTSSVPLSVEEAVTTENIGHFVDNLSEQPNPTNESLTAETPNLNQPQLENKDDLLRSIITTLSKSVDDKNFSKGMKLIIWLDTDALHFKNYANDQYRSRIMTALANERGYYFEDISFCVGKPAEELRATRIGKNESEYLLVVENVETSDIVSCKASISISGDAGSLLQKQYVLSSDEMKEKMISVYNIGAGRFPKIPIGYRENHIAIDDNPQSPYAEKNKYVSRMHAHIGFSDTFGFYLQVEKDGTRLMGKRTRIFRGEKIIECDNPQVKILLENGDLIELGKAVILKYVQLNDK